MVCTSCENKTESHIQDPISQDNSIEQEGSVRHSVDTIQKTSVPLEALSKLSYGGRSLVSLIQDSMVEVDHLDSARGSDNRMVYLLFFEIRSLSGVLKNADNYLGFIAQKDSAGVFVPISQGASFVENDEITFMRGDQIDGVLFEYYSTLVGFRQLFYLDEDLQFKNSKELDGSVNVSSGWFLRNKKIFIPQSGDTIMFESKARWLK